MTFVIKNLEHTAKSLLSRINETKQKIENKEYIDDLQKINMYSLIKRLECNLDETKRAINTLYGGVN